MKENELDKNQNGQQGQQENPQEKEADSLRNQLLRLQADFENAKKRWLKREAELQEFANKDMLAQLLEIHDDFQRALAAEAQQENPGLFRTGVEMIGRRMETFLKSYGVEPINAKGKLFDPEQHEAVAHEATEAVAESTVLEELRKGYLLNGRVLRPSVVKVAVKPEAPAPESKDNKSEGG